MEKPGGRLPCAALNLKGMSINCVLSVLQIRTGMQVVCWCCEKPPWRALQAKGKSSGNLYPPAPAPPRGPDRGPGARRHRSLDSFYAAKTTPPSLQPLQSPPKTILDPILAACPAIMMERDDPSMGLPLNFHVQRGGDESR